MSQVLVTCGRYHICNIYLYHLYIMQVYCLLGDYTVPTTCYLNQNNSMTYLSLSYDNEACTIQESKTTIALETTQAVSGVRDILPSFVENV